MIDAQRPLRAFCFPRWADFRFSAVSVTAATTVLVVATAVVSALLGQLPWRPLVLVTPTTIIVSIIADIGAAVVLLAFRDTAATAARQLIAALFWGAALNGIAVLFCIKLTPDELPLIDVGPNASTWLRLAWQLQLAIGACAYAYMRGHPRAHAQSGPRSFIPGAISLLVAVASIVGCIAFSSHFPVLRAGEAFSALYRFVVAPSTVALLLIGATGVLRFRSAHEVDRGFAVAVIMTATSAALIDAGAERYSGFWYLGRVLAMLASVYVFEAAIRRLFVAKMRLHTVEKLLSHTEREAKRHAERTRSLWRIVSNTEDPDRMSTVLRTGVSALRPEADLVGYVAHLEGGEIVIDTMASSLANETIDDMAGRRFPLAITFESVLYAEGCALACNDVLLLDGAGELATCLGLKSVIGAPIRIGRDANFLVFGSRDALGTIPFGEDDLAYIDVLAAFVGHRVYELQQHERIQFQIHHDALTGLKNRTHFRSALRAAVAGGVPFALAVLDLDRFRAINERAGHLIGDELLVEVAVGLGNVDLGDIVARTSGDGFSIILPGAGSHEETIARLSPYTDLFRTPFHTGDRDGTRMLSASCSFGVALFPSDESTPEALLRAADVALDVAKVRGGAAVVFFDADMNADVERNFIQQYELEHAIKAGQLEVVYQPTFLLADCSITGAEALVRWNHPTRGQLPPGEFVGFAERNGLIGQLTRWVIDRVIADLRRLPAVPVNFRCFFNLAAAQLDDLAFIAELEQCLRFIPHVAGRLGVEITESAAMTNAASSMYALDQFRKLGLRIAIDDFGTGFSSLSYLKRLPIDIIKIDRSFVSGLPDDEKDSALCELLLQIAGRFELSVLAEGIENYPQLQWLREHGCGYGQGFLVSKPLPFKEFEALLTPRHTPPLTTKVAVG